MLGKTFAKTERLQILPLAELKVESIVSVWRLSRLQTEGMAYEATAALDQVKSSWNMLVKS